MSTPSKKPEKTTKLIKARILNEDGDLTFGLIEVPLEDARPEFNPKTDKLTEAKGAQLGSAPKE